MMMSAMNDLLSGTPNSDGNGNPAGSAGTSASRSSKAQKAQQDQQEDNFYHLGDRVVIPGGSVTHCFPSPLRCNPSHAFLSPLLCRHPGTIAYVGSVDYAPGEFIGVILDQPVGKNNGCPPLLLLSSDPPLRSSLRR
jgi:hypothetical protein